MMNTICKTFLVATLFGVAAFAFAKEATKQDTHQAPPAKSHEGRPTVDFPARGPAVDSKEQEVADNSAELSDATGEIERALLDLQSAGIAPLRSMGEQSGHGGSGPQSMPQ